MPITSYQELRRRALELALEHSERPADTDNIIETAGKYADFLISETLRKRVHNIDEEGRDGTATE